MAGLFRTLPTLVFTDEDNRELAVVSDATVVPSRGDNVRVQGSPYVVDRVGYDVVDNQLERVFLVCLPV